MNHAEQVAYLESWIQLLSVDVKTYSGAADYRQRRIDELNAYVKEQGERIKQLETELAAAKAQACKIVHVPGPVVVESAYPTFIPAKADLPPIISTATE
jgi:hypothetical protein